MKPIFSNLMAYDTALKLPENFSELLDKNAFVPLERHQIQCEGFAELNDEKRLIESDDRVLVRYVTQEKHINKTAFNAMLDERLKKIEEEGRELNPGEEWTIRSQLEKELLPYSPVTAISCYMLFCPYQERLYLSCGSENVAEMACSLMRKTLNSFPVFPVGFCHDLSERFSLQIAGRKTTPPLPAFLKVDSYGVLHCSGEKGKKVSTAKISFFDESIENLIKDDDLFVRSIDVALKAGEKENDEVEATFKLNMPANGLIILKKFDYEMSASIELDVSLANEEDDGGLAHQLAIEMLVVGRYAGRIFDALAKFGGGYINKDSVVNGQAVPAENEEENEADPLYEKAVYFITEKQKVSISGIQRQFRIGYNRAARFIELMEAQGVVSAPGHDGNRTVLQAAKSA